MRPVCACDTHCWLDCLHSLPCGKVLRVPNGPAHHRHNQGRYAFTARKGIVSGTELMLPHPAPASVPRREDRVPPSQCAKLP
ncbi:hypothetical protein SBA5_450070 [Candidatus Sulfotelmatomonas gaucii]|uniref:Uncharacterized protein n=1 Tax=Candidatus Sulfuritelmatomonas gaucii TaxID=2043161 RepID=A0A2N9LMF1_9BACT|nr:hypothetical protein SBA5_450070 [Candidatus Sulfotelmatomonas gaucii]